MKDIMVDTVGVSNKQKNAVQEKNKDLKNSIQQVITKASA